MKYKESARSPQYGKIFAYSITGKEVQELDILKLKVVHKEKEYTVGQLLQIISDHEEDFKKIKQLEKDLKKLQDRVNTLSQVVVLLDAQIKASEIK